MLRCRAAVASTLTAGLERGARRRAGAGSGGGVDANSRPAGGPPGDRSGVGLNRTVP
jgi:hypothetical protein